MQAEPQAFPLLSRCLRLGVVGAVGLFTVLTLSPDAVTRFYAWPWFFYWQVLLAVPVLGWLVLLLGGRQPVPRFGGWIDAGLLGGLAGLLGAAALSPFPRQSLSAAGISLAVVAGAYLALAWLEAVPAARAARSERLARALGWGLALVMGVSLAGWLGGDVGPAWAAGRSWREALALRNQQPFGHSIYVAGVAVLAAPWFAWLGMASRGWRRGGWWLAAGLAVGWVLSTSSRGGVLGLGVAVAAVLVFWWRGEPSPRRRWGALGLVLLAGVALAVAEPRLRELVRTGRWNEVASESNRQRAAMREAGWRMGCDRPVLGYGPGTVSLVYPRYRAELEGGVDTVLELHCTPAQLWAEQGALGGLALVLILVGAGRKLAQARRAGGAPAAMATAVAVVGAGYAAMAWTDYQLDVPLFGAVLAGGLALLGTAGGAPQFSRRGQRLVGVGGLVALALIGGALWPNLRARAAFAEAAAARAAGDEAAYVFGVERAVALAPWDPFYPSQMAAYFLDRARTAADVATRGTAQARAMTWLRQALVADPDLEYAYFNLGWLLLGDDPVEAERHFLAAARLVPDKGRVYLGLGFSRLAQRRPEAAVEAFAWEWINDPAALTSPLWEQAPLAALRPAVIAAWRRQLAAWLGDATLPAAVRDRLRYTAALAEWWWGAEPELPVLTTLGPAEARRFFHHLSAMGRRDYAPAGDPARLAAWEQGYLAWRDGRLPDAGWAEPVVAALSRRRERTHDSFVQWIVAPLGDESALQPRTWRQRVAFGIHLRNQDGFPLYDEGALPENLVVATWYAALFPPKGHLPTPLLAGARAGIAAPAP